MVATHTAAAQRPASRSTIVAAAGAPQSVDTPVLQRRSLAALIAAAPVLLTATRAFALIPDDDDEELVEKARANRKSRLASERATEKTFARTEGFVDGEEKKDLVPVQRAVNSLGLIGKQLAAGEVSAAADTLSGSWTSDLRAAADALSVTAGAKASAAQVVSKLGDLQSAAASGSLSGAKKEYVALVGSLESWASAAGISSAIKGL